MRLRLRLCLLGATFVLLAALVPGATAMASGGPPGGFIIPAGSTASFTNVQFGACNNLSWGYQLNGGPNHVQFTGGFCERTTTPLNDFSGFNFRVDLAISRPISFAPGGGSFVVGDQNVVIGSSVTFWGAQWWKLNSLSGGNSPASFKGFAKTPSTPACGTGWSTDPGNSTPPPAGPLPAFMGVIATSSSTQNGSAISGNTLHIVIVRTNPGYAPDSGHAGTGTVVAVVC